MTTSADLRGPGGVVADEPRAALVGREVLALGGTAADAAVATYFALSVTLPSSAALGGGGICVSYEPARKRMEVIDFLPRPTAGGGMAVPANVRGMALLHSRFGRLRWEQLLSGSESLARLGIDVSRALASDINQADPADLADPSFQRVFTGPDGVLLGEGGRLKQVELATVLSRIRTAGAGDFYAGPLGRQIVAGAEEVGGDLTLKDLRDFVAVTRPPLRIALGNEQVLLPAGAGGSLAADLLTMVNTTRYRAARQPERVHIMAEAVRRAVVAEASRLSGDAATVASADRAKRLMADYRPNHASPPEAVELPAAAAPPASSFVALDGYRDAVACSVTMNASFGTRRIIPGTGMLLAVPPAGGPISMVPLLAVNTNTDKMVLALGSSDGPYAAAAAIETLLGTMVEDRSLEDILARPRLADDGGTVLLEPEADDTAEALEQLGHTLREVKQIGRVNAIYCPVERPANAPLCQPRADPRGFGLATSGR
jgi:gamma-glutamyltranspeptidase/glutathione hydrolase